MQLCLSSLFKPGFLSLYLRGYYLRGYYLRGYYLRGYHFRGYYFRGCYFRGYYLRGYYLRGCYLRGYYSRGYYLEVTIIRAANTVSSKINSWSTSCYNHKNSRSLFTLQKLLSHWMSSVLTSMFQCFRCLRTFMCNHRRGRVLLLHLFLSPDIFAINFLFFIYRRCNCLMLLWQWP